MDPNDGLGYPTAGIDPLNSSTSETVTAATATPEPSVDWLAAAELITMIGIFAVVVIRRPDHAVNMLPRNLIAVRRKLREVGWALVVKLKKLLTARRDGVY